MNQVIDVAVQAPPRNWTALIDDVTAGRWVDPDTGRAADVPFKTIVIRDRLVQDAADLLARTMPSESYGVVCDENTVDVMGSAIAVQIGAKARLIVLNHPHADAGQVRQLQVETKGLETLVAVGSGTINDLCKFATYGDGRDYSVFGTAPSMNGYTSSTASITLDSGLKTTQGAHAAKGVFLDIAETALAPKYLIAAGFGDSLCRPTAQVDWFFSHRMLGSYYATSPYVLQDADEAEMLARSAGLGRHEHEAVGYLHRILTLGGLGIAVTRMSHPGSMGEHQISHWIDSFAGDRHPGTVHGTQVGVTSITMARLQEQILAMEEAPRIRPTVYDEAAIRARYPAAAVEACLKASRAKVMDQAAADRFNAQLAAEWPTLRKTLRAMMIPSATLAAHLRAAGGGTTPEEIGCDRALYARAVRHALEMRDRYSFLDLAADMGILDDFIEDTI